MLNSIRNAELQGKIVLCRLDLNVPIHNGVVLDDTKIIRSLDTIRFLAKNHAKIIVLSHLGRPKGVDKEFSLAPLIPILRKHLDLRIEFSDEVISDKSQNKVNELRNDGIDLLVLENIRFEDGETENDPQLARNLAKYADVFVFDAFGTAHRAHASTVGVCRYLPAYAGFLVENEYDKIITTLKSSYKTKLAIIGGSKISTKIGLVENFLESVDCIVIGGAMVFTFMKVQGIEVGKSLVEDDMLQTAKDLMVKAKNLGVELLFPYDFLIGYSKDKPWLENDIPKVVDSASIPSHAMGLDIGLRTIQLFKDQIQKSQTIIWNGPLGVFENELYRRGTEQIGRSVISRAVSTIVGGGDTVYAIKFLHDSLPPNIHISTGGGATLAMLSGHELPAISTLVDNY